jgi:ABC-type transport system involved in multi-copper enzyme maturation permease subunit
MATYIILVFWLISPVLLFFVADSFGLSSLPVSAPTLWEWIECSNPYYLAFAPYTNPGKVGLVTYLGFTAICLCLSALLLGLATLRIRDIALTQSSRSLAHARQHQLSRHFRGLAWRSRLPGPSLDGNPILWREWHRSKPSRLSRVVWASYTALGILWIVLSLQIVVARGGDQEMIAIMSMFQVALGLLLLSVGAATSLAEERVRGSLDVVLCTPLSTHSILAGKWWGTFLQARHVLAWAVILGGILVAESGHWISYLLMLGLIVAYCAVITSLGLALATWISRLGRAVALTVSVCVVFSIGWVVLVFLLAIPPGMNDDFLVSMVMGSPLYGTIFATLAITPGGLQLPGGVNAITLAFGTIFWTGIHSGVALLLFMATLASFDRCLGRISEVAARTIPILRKKDDDQIDIDFDDHLTETSRTSLG